MFTVLVTCKANYIHLVKNKYIYIVMPCKKQTDFICVTLFTYNVWNGRTYSNSIKMVVTQFRYPGNPEFSREHFWTCSVSHSLIPLDPNINQSHWCIWYRRARSDQSVSKHCKIGMDEHQFETALAATIKELDFAVPLKEEQKTVLKAFLYKKYVLAV